MMKVEALNNLIKSYDSVVLILLTIVEIAPIKVNPWSFVLKWVGKVVNGKMAEDIEELKKDIKDVKDRQEYDEAMLSRYRIIRASDEIMNGIELSGDHIETLGDDINIYDAYCLTHPTFKNHKGQNAKRTVTQYEEELMKNRKTVI